MAQGVHLWRISVATKTSSLLLLLCAFSIARAQAVAGPGSSKAEPAQPTVGPAQNVAVHDGFLGARPAAPLSLSAPAANLFDGQHDHAAPPKPPGVLLFDEASEDSLGDPINWWVTASKSRHQLLVYFEGRLFKVYHAVFGRNHARGPKLWEGDRRTPEGLYAIVSEHRSRRFRWFLSLNYPNLADRNRFKDMTEAGYKPDGKNEHPHLGGGIGIHGTDSPALNKNNVDWTTGCVSLSNDDIAELHRLLPVGTFVLINP